MRPALFAIISLFLFLPEIEAEEPHLERYTMDIVHQRWGVSGICIIKREKESTVMSVVNEFGIKAFDAIYNAGKGKVKLHNIVKPLDRCAIRRVLSKDLHSLLESELLPDTPFEFENKKVGIRYKLNPLYDAAQ